MGNTTPIGTMPSPAHFLPNLLPHYYGTWSYHSVLLTPALWLHCCGNFQTQIGEPLRELSLEPLFCSSLLASPGPHILLSGFVFGLTVLSLTCQWPVFSLPFPLLPFVSCYCVPSGFVMYSDKQNCYNVWYFCSVHNVVCACVGISLSIGETV